MIDYLDQRYADPGILRLHPLCMVASVATFATVIMFKVYCNPKPAFNNVACAKNCKCN